MYVPANFPSTTLSTEFLKRILYNIVFFLPKSNSTEMENKTNREKNVKFLSLIAIQDAAYLPDKFYLAMCNILSLSRYLYLTLFES
jgi:hypothetical protein